MAYKESENCITLEAGADLSAIQFYFVAVAADGQVDACGDGAVAVGVLQNDPAAAGRAAQVATSGVTRVKCGGTVTRGGPVASDAAGLAVDAASGDIILGEALETGATNTIISVMLQVRGAL